MAEPSILTRALDLALAAPALAVASPILAAAMLAIWIEDRGSPFYVASRVGREGRPFQMIKLRSMAVHADRSGVASTSADDRRITSVGALLRRLKLDELPQLWNVLRGEMSLVGPRPNVAPEVAHYTADERRLLAVRPGVTDLASIVFSDEGEILRGERDPDLAYNQIIRPWKSRLALIAVDHPSAGLYLRILALTAVALVSRPAAIAGVQRILAELGADDRLRQVAARTGLPYAYPPPGAVDIATRERIAS